MMHALVRALSLLTVLLAGCDGAPSSGVYHDAGKEAAVAPSSALSTADVVPSVPIDVPATPTDPLTLLYPLEQAEALRRVGIKLDPDGEVCRSINTTCGGSWPKDRCHESATSWTARLTSAQVNCVILAQRTTSVSDRAAWIRNCGAGIDCRDGSR